MKRITSQLEQELTYRALKNDPWYIRDDNKFLCLFPHLSCNTPYDLAHNESEDFRNNVLPVGQLNNISITASTGNFFTAELWGGPTLYYQTSHRMDYLFRSRNSRGQMGRFVASEWKKNMILRLLFKELVYFSSKKTFYLNPRSRTLSDRGVPLFRTNARSCLTGHPQIRFTDPITKSSIGNPWLNNFPEIESYYDPSTEKYIYVFPTGCVMQCDEKQTINTTPKTNMSSSFDTNSYTLHYGAFVFLNANNEFKKIDKKIKQKYETLYSTSWAQLSPRPQVTSTTIDFDDIFGDLD